MYRATHVVSAIPLKLVVQASSRITQLKHVFLTSPLPAKKAQVFLIPHSLFFRTKTQIYRL